MQALPPLPPTPPLPGFQITGPVAGGPSDVYRAMREQRSELRDQLGNLEEKRQELQRELQQMDGNDEGRAGVVARLKELDARISLTDAQIAEADLAVAKAAAIPGAVIEDPPEIRTGPPEEVFVLGGLFMVVCLLPITIAYARRIWRRGATVIAPIPQDVRDRILQLGDAVESIGLEVERIGEGQRFITKVLAEQPLRVGVPAAADPVEARPALPR